MCKEEMWWETFPDFKDKFSNDLVDRYWDYVDYIMSEKWIELEKCSWNKKNIWEVNWNQIFIYKISKKYMTKNNAEIYIKIWGNRENKYRINFDFNIWEMNTWDYKENHNKRVEKTIVFYDRILIQDKKTKLWKNMWKKTEEFKNELDNIIKLIKLEYLNPQINKQ